MAYGFRVRTDSGIIQVDDNFHNLAYIAKGTVVMDQNGSSTGLEWIRYGALALSGRDTPVLALRSNVPVGYRRVENRGSGNWYYELCFDSLYGMSAAVDWYLFDRPVPATSGWGIRIRNAAGAEVFNSNHRYFNPRAFVPIPAGQPSARATPWDYTGLPVGTYAYVPAASRYANYSFTIFGESNGTSALTDGVQALSNGVRIAPAPQQDQAPYAGDAGIYLPPSVVGYVTIIDVAGY